MNELVRNKFIQLVFGLLVIYYIIIYFAGIEKDAYQCIPLATVLNSVILICIAVYFSGIRSNLSEQKKRIEYMLTKIMTVVNSEEMYIIDTPEKLDNVRLQQRRVFNELGILEIYAVKLNYKDKLEYCQTEFKRYWEAVSEDLEDLNKLKQDKKFLHKFLINIGDKLDEIYMDLDK